MSTTWSLLVSLVLLVANAFFVAAEFALIAAKRHRLEQDVETSRAARAAVAGIRELSLMLAGAQLGITLCTLGLGALAKPAVADLIDPLLLATDLPSGVSYAVAFTISLVLVVFLHMVVGEMAPKSWAIARPERSAMLLAPPFRAVVKTVRPLIGLLNRVSNALVRLCRVTPRDELASVHNREQLTHLVEESQRLGLITDTDSELITRSLTEPETPVGDLAVPAAEIPSVAADAGTEDILRTAADHDRTRLLVRDRGTVLGSVHARDALVARARGRTTTARTLARPVPELTEDTTVADAIDVLRKNRASLAVICDDTGRPTALVSLDDLLARYLQPLVV
jgi:CBS domain containing-hemolysin-like protein